MKGTLATREKHYGRRGYEIVFTTDKKTREKLIRKINQPGIECIEIDFEEAIAQAEAEDERITYNDKK